VRHLMAVVVLLTIALLAPAARGETTKASAPRPGVHRHAPAPKSKTPARAARRPPARHTVRKAPATTASSKGHAPVRRVPAKRVVVTEVILV
jgi:hypothetical protein